MIKILAATVAITTIIPSTFSAAPSSSDEIRSFRELTLAEELVANIGEVAPELRAAESSLNEDTVSWHSEQFLTEVPLDPDQTLTTSSTDLTHEADITLSFSLPEEVEVEDSIVSSDNSVVYYGDSIIKSDSIVAQITDSGSIRVQTVTTSKDSPTTFSYPFSEQVEVEVQSTGAAALLVRGELIGIVEHPWSYDSTGKPIKTWFTAEKNILRQHIVPQSDTAFPVISDPQVGVFVTRGDHVHVTRGEASGHGWWIKGTTKATKAKVTVKLQTNTSIIWLNRATGTRTIGPGTSKRANARFSCKGTKETRWRSIIDVDLIGYLDSPNKVVTETKKLKCSP